MTLMRTHLAFPLVLLGLSIAHVDAGGNTIVVQPTDDLAAVIEEAADGHDVVLAEGLFTLGAREPHRQGILVQDKAGLTIRARRPGRTMVKFASDVKFGFYIGSNVSDLTIENLHLEGTPPLRENIHAIGSFTSSTNVRRVAFTGLRIENVAVGISVATSENGIYDGVQVSDNILTRFHGTEAGWGYGIHCESARNVRISRNVIEGASRHSIYIARAAEGANLSVDRNLIANHNLAGKQPRWYCAALVCSRAGDVRIAHNVIVNPNAIAVSVERDEVHGRSTRNVMLLNNRVIGSRYVGIWLTTGNVHTGLGNTVIPHAAPAHPEWCVDVSSFDYPRGQSTSSKLVAPRPRWASPDFVAELDGFMYVLKDGTLDKVAVDSWRSATCPTPWPDTAGMCALENARGEGKGRLYIADASGLHEVDPDTWRVNRARGRWSDTQFMAAGSGYVYALKKGVLYRISPASLRWQAGPDDWSATLGMWIWRGHVYLLSNETCYRIDPATITGRPVHFSAGDPAAPSD